MKKILVIAVILVQLVFSSCDKNELPASLSSNPTIEQLFNDSSTVFDGQFLINEERSLATQLSTPEIVSASGAFVNKQNSVIYDPGAVVKLNQYEIHKNNSDYQGMFENSEAASIVGNDVTITSVTRSGNSDVDFSTHLYFPIAIHMNMSSYTPMGFDTANNFLMGTILQENSKILWNPDSKNALGVIFFLEYDPNATGNQALKDAGYDKSITNYNVVVDNGSCPFDNELLEDIPNGAIVTLKIYRVNTLSYILPRNPDKKIRFVFATSETAKFKVSKAIK